MKLSPPCLLEPMPDATGLFVVLAEGLAPPYLLAPIPDATGVDAAVVAESTSAFCLTPFLKRRELHWSSLQSHL